MHRSARRSLEPLRQALGSWTRCAARIPLPKVELSSQTAARASSWRNRGCYWRCCRCSAQRSPDTEPVRSSSDGARPPSPAGTAQKQRKLDPPLPPLLPSPSLSFCSSRLPARFHPPPIPASGTAMRLSTHPPPRGAGRHLRHAGRLRGGAGTSPRRFMRFPSPSCAPSAPRTRHGRRVPNDRAPPPGRQATGLNPFVALCRAGDFWRRAVPLLIRYRLEEQAAPPATPLSIVRRCNGLHADSTGCAAHRSTTAPSPSLPY